MQSAQGPLHTIVSTAMLPCVAPLHVHNLTARGRAGPVQLSSGRRIQTKAHVHLQAEGDHARRPQPERLRAFEVQGLQTEGSRAELRSAWLSKWHC